MKKYKCRYTHIWTERYDELCLSSSGRAKFFLFLLCSMYICFTSSEFRTNNQEVFILNSCVFSRVRHSWMGEPCSRCGAVWGGPPGEVCDLCRSLGRLVGCVQEAPVNPSLRHALLVRVRTWTGETQDLIDRCREAEGRQLLSSKSGSGLQPPGGLAPYTGPLPPPQGGVAVIPKAGGCGGE